MPEKFGAIELLGKIEIPEIQGVPFAQSENTLPEACGIGKEVLLMTSQKYLTVIIEKCPPCGNRKGTPLLGS